MRRLIYCIIISFIFFIACKENEEPADNVETGIINYLEWNTEKFPLVNSYILLKEKIPTIITFDTVPATDTIIINVDTTFYYIFNVAFAFTGVPYNNGDIDGGSFGIDIISRDSNKLSLGDYTYSEKIDTTDTIYNYRATESHLIFYLNDKSIDSTNNIKDIKEGVFSVLKNDSIYEVSFKGEDSIENHYDVYFRGKFNNIKGFTPPK